MTAAFYLRRFTTDRCGLRGAALLRCGLASIVLVYLVLHIGVRYELWGPQGIYELRAFDEKASISLYSYASSSFAFDAVYFGSIVSAVLYAMGIATRITSWIFFVAIASLVARNPFAIDAGQTAIVLLAFLLCFTDSARYLSMRPPHAPKGTVSQKAC